MPIVFDQTYFEGTGELGYADYTQQHEYLIAERDFILANFDLTGIPCLEVGCGFGFLTKLMRDAGIDWTGIDVSSHAISQDVSGGFIQQSDVRSMPFGTNAFRFCAALYVLECLETDAEIDAAVTEIRRVLHNSQGDLYIVTALGLPFPYYVSTRAAWETKVLSYFPQALFFDGIAYQPSVRTVIVRGN